jgi:hypothetical protein
MIKIFLLRTLDRKDRIGYLGVNGCRTLGGTGENNCEKSTEFSRLRTDAKVGILLIS